MKKFRFVAPVIAGMLVLAACTSDGGSSAGASAGASGGGASSGGTGSLEQGDGKIEVTSLWGGAEADAFQAVLDAFTEATDIQVEYTSVRQDYATVLNNRLAQNDPPDVAIIPGIGFLRSFAKDDLLIPLSDLGIDEGYLSSAYAENLADMGQSVGSVDGTAYAVMVKLNSKGTVWYKPDSFDENGWTVPETWDDMLALTEQIKSDGSTPWAVGAADGWTLTDWFEMVYLTQAGPDAYDTLFSADGNWTDQTVLDAASAMTEIINNDNVVGGLDGALATGFVDGIGQVFSANADAQLYYEGGFVGGIALGDVNPDLEIGTGIDFFDFPGAMDQGITVGGDVMAAFVADSDVAEFMKYLASTEGGTKWAEGGTIISPMAGVDTSVYESVNQLVVQEAEQIASAPTARFDGSDLLPAGTDLGAVLQRVIQSPDEAQSAFEQFQSEVDAAWAELEG